MVLNVPMEEPTGGKHNHLLWMIMLLKDDSNGNNLAGQCGVCHEMFRVWVEQFIECLSKISFLSLHMCLIVACFFNYSYI